MQPIFEAKYLAIEWFDENIVSKITEAIFPIEEIEIQDNYTYSMEIQAYKRIENGFDGQIAFHILDNTNDVQPYFKKANSEKINLLKIIDPNSKKEWWIEDGNWSNKYRYRTSELWNHAGEATVFFGNIACHIDIRAVSFTKNQLDLYLEDFKNDFWYLILKKNSLTQAGARNSIEEIKILNEETIECIKNFIKHIQDILKNPKKELKEIQNLKDIKQVKPVVKTFMEIATGGMKRKLTSRDTIESYNVAENKYIHYALYQVYLVVFNMTKASQYINNFYQNKVKSEQSRVDNFKDTIIIDKEIIENTIQNLEKKIEEIKNVLINISEKQDSSIEKECVDEINQPAIDSLINNAINNQNIQQRNIDKLKIFRIRLEKKQTGHQNTIQFRGRIRNHDKEEWDGIGTADVYILEFDLNLFDFLESNQEFLVTANTRYFKKQNANNTMHEIYFTYISELQILNITKPIITIKYQTLHISLQKKQNFNNDRVQFWGKARLENTNDWHQFPQNESLSMEFDKNIFDGILQEYTEYRVTAYIEKYTTNGNNNKKIHKRYFKYVTNIEQTSKSSIDKQLVNLFTKKKNLIATNWVSNLTTQEIQEQEKEKQAIIKQIQLLNEESKTTSEYIKQLEPLIQALRNILNQFDKLSISKNSYFPNSMTFIQNPHYHGGYKYYELIKNIIGIDESLFLSIQKVEKIGLLDIPKLYERWCLLQIIKVLIDNYHFIPDENWKSKLSFQMLGENGSLKDEDELKNISITFDNHDSKRRIELWYEKELNGRNSKRPDFVIDIKSLRTKKTHRLVMDAKFKEDVNVKALIEEMYHKKNYSQNHKNTVFILHPDTNKSIAKKLTDKDWGTDAYYGEVQMFDYAWDNDNTPNHKYGSILLSPIRNENKNNYGNYLDNLQRLIGMAMQYQLEENQNIRNDDKKLDSKPKEKAFCLKCGNWNIRSTVIPIGDRGFKYNCICANCEHFFIYSYCQHCKTRLIKNGLYWSYHASQIDQQFNIRCPNCNEIFVNNNGE